MAVRIMAGIGAALLLVGILLTCATMLFADVTWREVADVLSESPLHVEVHRQPGRWHPNFGCFRSDDGPFKMYLGNMEIEITW